MKRLCVPLLAAAAVLAGCAAQPAGGGISADRADAILAELRDIKRLIAEQRPKTPEAEAAAQAKVRLADVAPNVIGAATAAVTLIEFTDYECPFCRRFHEHTWPELRAKYVATGKVRFVVRDMPLAFHSQALPAAVAARCAGEQGRFAAVFDALIAAPELSATAVRAIVARAGVAAAPFERCVAGPAVHQAIELDTAEAERLGINGTPGFVIAQRSGSQLEGVVVVGAQPLSAFTSRLDALLGAPRAN